jgi:hypothetical protein
VVAAVPLAVPDREALLGEQVGAEAVRGEVDRARLPDQVADREQHRDRHRRDVPPVDARVPGLRGRSVAGEATATRRSRGARRRRGSGAKHGDREG